MKLNNLTKGKRGESGNVLFLILIAVALFAALSYAVTQSTRSGAGDTNSETNLISSAQLTQYPAGIRTSVVRMLIAGIAVEELLFNTPSDFTLTEFTQTNATGDSFRARGVFHPQGGNATYQYAPGDVLSVPPSPVAGYQSGRWYYNAVMQIQNIGLTDGTNVSSDVVAWLPYVSDGVCRRLNEELGIDGIPVEADVGVADIAIDMEDLDGGADVGFPDPPAETVTGDGAAPGEFAGQPFGCFEGTGGDNIYYHVLIER